MTRARELAELGSVYDSGALSNRNLIINGAMAIAQRNTSSTSGGYVSLDRWYVNQSGGSTTFSQETNTNPSETGGLQKYARLNVSSSSDFTAVLQRIEDVTSVPEGTVAISFYAKGTAPTGGLKVWCTQVFGSGGSSDVDIAEQVIATSLTSSWVRYTLNITVPSVDGKTIGTGSYFMVTIGQGTDTASTAYDLNITGVQLEVGDTATPFEHRKFSEELQACQRYFAKSYPYDRFAGNTSSHGNVQTEFHENNQGSGYREYYGFPFPVRMRATPSITIYDFAGNSARCNYYIGATLGNSNKVLNVSAINDRTFGGYSDRATTIGGWACHYYADAEL